MVDNLPEFRIAVLGDGGVGKTSVLMRLVMDQFEEEYDPTLYDYFSKIFEIDGQQVRIIFDEDGAQEDWESKARRYTQANGIFFVYSITEPQSLERLREHLDLIARGCNRHCSLPIVVVGNKIDLNLRRKVTPELRELTLNAHEPHFEVSAKVNINMREPLDSLVRTLLATPPAKAKSAAKLQKCVIQ